MNQTVTVNISGMVFHIEVDAYDKLKNYLNKIKSYFHNSEESVEIMADIEARIAELFNARLTGKNQVIVSKDVEEVITIMGKPEQFADDQEEDSEQGRKEERKSSEENWGKRKNKRIFRDPDDRIIGGVASGLGAYFGMEPVWIRLIWAISIFFFGFGVMLYILLWIIIPEAKTASDKLEMKGEAVNFKNIGRTFEEEAERVRDNFSKMDKSSVGNKVEHAFRTFFNLIGVLLKGLFKVLGKIIGVILLLVAIFLAIFFIAGMGSSAMFSAITDNGAMVFDLKQMFITALGTDTQYEFARYALMGLIGIPILGLIFGAMRLLFNVKGNSGIGGGMAALWFICVVTLGVIGAQIGTDFTNDGVSRSEFPVQQDQDTLSLLLKDTRMPGNEIFNANNQHFLALSDSMIHLGYPEIDVVKSKDDSTHLRVKKTANGGSRNEASDNAENIAYGITQEGDKLFFDPYFSFPRINKWRSQEVKLILELPVGKAVFFHPTIEDVIFDIGNVSNTWDHDMIGHVWIMTDRGLACSDCPEEEDEMEEEEEEF